MRVLCLYFGCRNYTEPPGKGDRQGDSGRHGGKGGSGRSSEKSANAKYLGGKEKKSRVIVFVHGVMGNGDSTWTNEASGAFFPELIADDPKFANANVYVHSFPTSAVSTSLSIDELTEHMRRHFTNDNIFDHDEVVFVCHSMGGLVTRGFLLKYRDRVQGKVPMIYFFATPGNGSSLANVASVFSKNPQFIGMRGIANNDFLRNQRNSWVVWEAGKNIKCFCAYEKQKTYGLMVVDETSATALSNQRLDPIDRDHIHICKPLDETDDPYIALRTAYQEVFGGGDESEVELNQQTAVSLLPTLRSGLPKKSIVVREPFHLDEVAKGRDEWTVQNLRFEDNGCIFVGNVDLAVQIRGRLFVPESEAQIFRSFVNAKTKAANGRNGRPGEHGAAGAGHAGQNGRPGMPGGDGQNGKHGADGQPAGNVDM